MNYESQTTFNPELTPKMARFVQWLQDHQAQDIKTPASDQIWDYLMSLPQEENPH